MNESSWKDPRTFKPRPLFLVETDFETLEAFGYSSYATLLASLLRTQVPRQAWLQLANSGGLCGFRDLVAFDIWL